MVFGNFEIRIYNYLLKRYCIYLKALNLHREKNCNMFCPWGIRCIHTNSVGDGKLNIHGLLLWKVVPICFIHPHEWKDLVLAHFRGCSGVSDLLTTFVGISPCSCDSEI